MILKPFESYEITLGLAALLKRLEPSHEKYQQILDDLNKQEAGEHGERHVLTLLTENQLPDQTYVLHNISFKSKVQTQIDILVISAFWCLVLEVKNIKGDLYFKSNPRQLVRRNLDGTEEILGMPEIQIEKYCFGLESLFANLQIKIPIYRVIIFPFNNANIKKTPETIPLLIGYEIIRYIWSLPKTEKVIEPREVSDLILKNQHYKDERFPLCNYYQIDPKLIRTGVECPNCGTIPMWRSLRTWKCQNCGITKVDAHLQALIDYQILLNNRITNKECVRFLNLRNRQEATRILTKVGNRSGYRRNSIFELNSLAISERMILNGQK